MVNIDALTCRKKVEKVRQIEKKKNDKNITDEEAIKMSFPISVD